MKKPYEQKQIALHERSLVLFKEAEEKHIRMLEIEEECDEGSPYDTDFCEEYDKLHTDLAFLMRDQVDIALQAEHLKLEHEEDMDQPKVKLALVSKKH